MATNISFINYVCEQLQGIGNNRYKKMFGEYMVYINDKPIVLVCENTAFVKKLDCVKELLENADVACPYKGAKEHYVLDMDDADFCRRVVSEIEKVTPLPKKKK